MANTNDPNDLSNSSMIADVQRALSSMGYGPLDADGVLGATTREAVQKFKVDHKITPADRVVDQKTYEAVTKEFKYGRAMTALKYVGGGAALLGLGVLAKKALSRSKAEADVDPYAKYRPLYNTEYRDLAGVLEPRAVFSRVKIYDEYNPPPAGVKALSREEFAQLCDRAYDQASERLEELHAQTMKTVAVCKRNVADGLRDMAYTHGGLSFSLKNPEHGPAFPLPR